MARLNPKSKIAILKNSSLQCLHSQQQELYLYTGELYFSKVMDLYFLQHCTTVCTNHRRKQLLMIIYRAIILLTLLSLGCGKKYPPFVAEPQPGCTIAVSALKYHPSSKKFTGVLTIRNRTESFVRVSNREFYLFCGRDSSRTFVSLRGSWEIDEGLINIPSGKTITIQTCWPLERQNVSDTLYVKYIPQLSRE